jgi:hypothetical protein
MDGRTDRQTDRQRDRYRQTDRWELETKKESEGDETTYEVALLYYDFTSLDKI